MVDALSEMNELPLHRNFGSLVFAEEKDMPLRCS